MNNIGINTPEPMRTWKHAAQRIAWIPKLVFVLYALALILTSILAGLQWSYILILTLTFLMIFVLFYLPLLLIERYPEQTTRFMLAGLGTLFALGSIKQNFVSDAIRSFIQSKVDSDFFVGFLAVWALLIAVVDIQKRKHKSD